MRRDEIDDPTVRRAAHAEHDRVVGAIARAFATDPVARWAYPDAHRYVTTFPAFIVAFGGKAFEHGSAHCTADFYQRHGFEVVGTIQVGDAPPLFPMVRRPR